jgi:hypothetical protein
MKQTKKAGQGRVRRQAAGSSAIEEVRVLQQSFGEHKRRPKDLMQMSLDLGSALLFGKAK